MESYVRNPYVIKYLEGDVNKEEYWFRGTADMKAMPMFAIFDNVKDRKARAIILDACASARLKNTPYQVLMNSLLKHPNCPKRMLYIGNTLPCLDNYNTLQVLYDMLVGKKSLDKALQDNPTPTRPDIIQKTNQYNRWMVY